MIHNDLNATKICNKCGIEKQITEFPRYRGNKYRSICKVCKNAADLEKAQNASEDKKARRREIVAKSKAKKKENMTAEYKEKIKESNQRYYDKNKDAINAKVRVRMKADPERRERKREQRRTWAKANPDKVKIFRAKRIISQTLGGNTALQDYVEILLGDPCSYCGGVTETIDHIVPLACGGKNEVYNITAACMACNSAKNDTKLIIFLARRAQDEAMLKAMQESNTGLQP